MVTFPGAVHTQTLRGLLHNHTLSQVKSQRYWLSIRQILQYRVYLAMMKNPLINC